MKIVEAILILGYVAVIANWYHVKCVLRSLGRGYEVSWTYDHLRDLRLAHQRSKDTDRDMAKIWRSLDALSSGAFS